MRLRLSIQVVEEIDRVLKGQPPTVGDLERLVYLTQVIKEAMRVYSPGPFAARLMEEETKLGQYTLPRDVWESMRSGITDHTSLQTTLFYPLSVIHMCEKYWPNPARFDPDRFSPENSKTIAPGASFKTAYER